MERWKPVSDYKNLLEISDRGRVRTKSTWRAFVRRGKPGQIEIRGRILQTHPHSHGYLVAHPKVGAIRPKLLVHRLVAMAFVPGYRPDLSVNHINGKKTDNRAENLEWCTRARNTQMEWEDGLVDLRADKHPGRKLHSGQVRIMRRLLGLGATCGELATLTGVSAGTVYLIRDGKRWNSIT